MFATIFAEDVLKAELQFANVMLDISKTIKAISEYKFPEAPDWVKTILSTAGQGALAMSPLGPAAAIAGMATAAGKAAFSSPTSAMQSSMASAQAISDAVPRTGNYDSITAAQFIGPPAPGAKTPEALAADLRNLVSVLGSAATPSEKLNANIAELGVRASAAGVSADVLARGVAGLRLDAAISQQSAYNSALGASASVSDIVAAKQLQLQKAQEQGAGLSKEQINTQLQMTEAQSSGLASINAQIDAEKVRAATLGMSTEQGLAYSIAQSEINRQLAAGRPIQDINTEGIKEGAAELAKLTVATNHQIDVQQQLKDMGASFGNDFVQGLLSGKKGIDALTDAMANLGKTLTSTGINNIFKDPTNPAGYIEAGAGIIDQLITGNSQAQKKAAEQLQEAKDAWEAMTAQVIAFNQAASGLNLGPLTSQLQSLYSTYQQLDRAAFLAQDWSGEYQLMVTFSGSISRIVSQFEAGTQALTPLQTAIKGVSDEAQGLKDTLAQTGVYGLGEYEASIDASAQAQIDALTKQYAASFAQSLTERLNTANGQSYLNDASALLTQHQQDLSDAAAYGNDPALLAQVAATFHAEAQKIVEDAGLTGDSFDQFIQMFPDFAGVVTQSATALQAANDKFAALTKTISDYLDSLQLGSNSILSPQDQLNAAQSQFNAQLTLAQQGNTDALGSITQYASTLLDQAKSYYASSEGYSAIYSAVSSALSALVNQSPPGMATGGVVPGYAGGGVVGNGLFNVDSVMARYAGGGSVALAGGEHVTPGLERERADAAGAAADQCDGQGALERQRAVFHGADADAGAGDGLDHPRRDHRAE